MISLLTHSTLTFDRDGGDGEYNESGEWVPATPTQFTAQGNLQPFRQGKEQTILPEGKTAGDAFIFYTKTQLKTTSQFTDTLADETVIDGLAYYVLAVEDWSKQGTLLPQHYKCILLRKDQNTNGGL